MQHTPNFQIHMEIMQINDASDLFTLQGPFYALNHSLTAYETCKRQSVNKYNYKYSLIPLWGKLDIKYSPFPNYFPAQLQEMENPDQSQLFINME